VSDRAVGVPRCVGSLRWGVARCGGSGVAVRNSERIEFEGFRGRRLAVALRAGFIYVSFVGGTRPDTPAEGHAVPRTPWQSRVSFGVLGKCRGGIEVLSRAGRWCMAGRAADRGEEPRARGSVGARCGVGSGGGGSSMCRVASVGRRSLRWVWGGCPEFGAGLAREGWRRRRFEVGGWLVCFERCWVDVSFVGGAANLGSPYGRGPQTPAEGRIRRDRPTGEGCPPDPLAKPGGFRVFGGVLRRR